MQKVSVSIFSHVKFWSIIFLSFPHFNCILANKGGRCREGLEDHHIQTGLCNSFKKELLLCIHVLASKQRRMPTCCLPWVPWETFKITQEISRLHPQRGWIDEVLSPWVTQSAIMCWHVVVYQGSFGRSTVVRSSERLCFLWEDV
jgi:hypothetical protein